ncbi:MAG: hypothetical protein P1P65_04905 [Treponema sp.]
MSRFDTAYLSNDGSYTLFFFNNTRLKFAAPYSLEKYEKVLRWDNGYLEVLAKYTHNSEPEEEYIDLVPILKNLYIDTEEFLPPIKKVKVRYA